MTAQFCVRQLEEVTLILRHHASLMLTLCAFILAFSLVAVLGNLLVIRALWKSLSIPGNLKKLLLSLAVSDLAMGFFAQPMFGVTIAIMLNMTASGNYNFDVFCPLVFTTCHFSLFLLACASLLNVTAIAADRLLAIFLHLRYQELVTPRRVIIVSLSLWITSGVAASIYILLPNNNDRVSEVFEFAGLLVTTVAYICLFRTVRHHQNQIQSQFQQQNGHAMEELRKRKTAINALFVYLVFLICYLPYFCCTILLIVDKFRISFLAAYEVSFFLLLLNSSLNPIVYCWRYREIREITKNIITKILRIY